MESDLYALTIRDFVLIYSPLRDLAALVNSSAARALQKRVSGSDAGDVDTESGAIDSLWEQISTATPRKPAPLQGPIRPDFLGILPTRRCNGACHYCSFGALQAPEDSMDLELAVTAVDWMARQARGQGRERLEIHFFGGEPLVAGEVVDTVVHRARLRARQLGLLPHFELATNGVCDESRARWLGDYFDTVVLSLDGPQKIQDRQRPLAGGASSFPAAARTAAIISASPARLCLRCCVSALTVEYMPAIARWFCESFQPSAVNFQTVEATESSQQLGIVAPDPFRFARNYLTAERILNANGVAAVYAAISPDGPRHTLCPVGRDTVIVSPDGRISGCYQLRESWQARGLDLDFGRMESGRVRIEQESVDRLRRLVQEKPRCRNCFCRWQCAGGCHVDVTYPGCSTERTPFCVQTRLILASHLLESMDRSDLVDALWQDTAALEALGAAASDRLVDWPQPAAPAPSAPCPSPGVAREDWQGRAVQPSAGHKVGIAPFSVVPDSVSWTVDADAISVFDQISGRSRRLSGAEAALWDLLSRSRQLDEIVRVVAAVRAQDEESTKHWIDGRVEEWTAQGWLLPRSPRKAVSRG